MQLEVSFLVLRTPSGRLFLGQARRTRNSLQDYPAFLEFSGLSDDLPEVFGSVPGSQHRVSGFGLFFARKRLESCRMT